MVSKSWLTMTYHFIYKVIISYICDSDNHLVYIIIQTIYIIIFTSRNYAHYTLTKEINIALLKHVYITMYKIVYFFLMVVFFTYTKRFFFLHFDQPVSSFFSSYFFTFFYIFFNFPSTMSRIAIEIAIYVKYVYCYLNAIA